MLDAGCLKLNEAKIQEKSSKNPITQRNLEEFRKILKT